jgi:hypothetical protein
MLVLLGLFGCGEERLGVEQRDLHQVPMPCEGRLFPMSVNPLARECCQLGHETFHISPTSGGVVHRVYGPACTDSNGGTTCVGMECTYGPCGAHNMSVTGTATSYIFKPTSNPAVCGWQAGGATIVFDPEPFTGQELYPDIPALCPWTLCPGGGLPAVALTVVAVENGASGGVHSDPAGIDLAGAGTAEANFTQRNVTLTATPVDQAQVVFSGACVAIGHRGAVVQCPVTLGPNKTVTVTYQ